MTANPAVSRPLSGGTYNRYIAFLRRGYKEDIRDVCELAYLYGVCKGQLRQTELSNDARWGGKTAAW